MFEPEIDMLLCVCVCVCVCVEGVKMGQTQSPRQELTTQQETRTPSQWHLSPCAADVTGRIPLPEALPCALATASLASAR